MFGYVVPRQEELKVKEQTFYKSVYCGLCRQMGKRVCPESRMTLSYDMVFLALVRLYLTGEAMSFRLRRCGVSPKKRPMMEGNEALSYAAAAGALLAYHNLADNVADSRGMKKTAYRALLGLARRMRRKAELTELDEIIHRHLVALSDEEKKDPPSVDACADCFGKLLGEVFAYRLNGTTSRLAYDMGLHIGRWIYLIDAADDYRKDKKHGEFNPLPEPTTDRILCSLNMELTAAARAFDLMEESDRGIRHIIENILYEGMPTRQETVLARLSSPSSSDT